MDAIRHLFTKHGLHLNGLGKELLTINLAHYIFSVLTKLSDKKTPGPITLKWKIMELNENTIMEPKNKELVNLVTTILDQLGTYKRNGGTNTSNIYTISSSRMSSKVRKVPVTRHDDFLW